MDGAMRKSLRGGIGAEILALNIDIVVRNVSHSISRRRHRDAIRPAKEPAVAVVLADREAALVAQLVMRMAQEHQVLEAGLAAGRPVLDVMRIDEALAAAARETTAAIARP
jgi:hypothetical protein